MDQLPQDAIDLLTQNSPKGAVAWIIIGSSRKMFALTQDELDIVKQLIAEQN